MHNSAIKAAVHEKGKLMALTVPDTQFVKPGQSPRRAPNNWFSELASFKSAFAQAARDIAAAPYFASAVLRVVSGLAAGFWLVQMVKLHVG